MVEASTTMDQGLRSTPIVALEDPAARDPALVGAKAAALATAAAAGLPTLPGFVLTVGGVRDLDRRREHVTVALRQAMESLSARLGGSSGEGLGGALIVRSSSTAEDHERESMAGRFTSVPEVVGFDALMAAIREVLDQAADVSNAPIAVLVQPMVHPRFGGVLFGADPVTGRRDRRVVAAVEGSPSRLVSGVEDGARYELDRQGRLRASDRRLASLGAGELRRLNELADEAARVFGGPQDIEWAMGDDGSTRLLQARPITSGLGHGQGPVLGRGPMAETFPERLAPLEVDLWVPPLDAGLRHALAAIGIAGVPDEGAVRSIDGWVVADLELFERRRPRWWQAFNPRVALGRLRSAWRIGRVRAELPGEAAETARRLDDRLRSVPALQTCTDQELLGILEYGRAALEVAHRGEILAGLVNRRGDVPSRTAAAMGLDALAAARAEGLPENWIAAAHPAVLALCAPSIAGGSAGMAGPDEDGTQPHDQTDPHTIAAGSARLSGAGLWTGGAADAREWLRLRSRWVQELTARAAAELGRRLAARGLLDAPADVAGVRLEELYAAVGHGRAPAVDRSPPRLAAVPTRFRLDGAGRPVAVGRPRRRGRAPAPVGTPAGPGQGRGRVCQDPASVQPGDVLVVGHLDPRLAPVLAQLGALVAETGSELSHLAILAREHGVPTVVAVADARQRYPEGAVVEVDGSAGRVEVAASPAEEGSGGGTAPGKAAREGMA